MTTKSKHSQTCERTARSVNSNDLINTLDALRVMPPPLRRYLRDYPSGESTAILTPARRKINSLLIQAGFLTMHETPSLTHSGLLAQAEIWAAQRYVTGLMVATY